MGAHDGHNSALLTNKKPHVLRPPIILRHRQLPALHKLFTMN